MPPPSSAAARTRSPAEERLAALLALPLREDPEAPEEAAIFEQAEADLRAGRTQSAVDIAGLIERMPGDQGG